MKNKVPQEISEYMSTLGKKGAASLKEKYGKDYFKKLAAKRRTVGNFRKCDICGFPKSEEYNHQDCETACENYCHDSIFQHFAEIDDRANP